MSGFWLFVIVVITVALLVTFKKAGEGQRGGPGFPGSESGAEANLTPFSDPVLRSVHMSTGLGLRFQKIL